jgi:hypothetical protein
MRNRRNAMRSAGLTIGLLALTVTGTVVKKGGVQMIYVDSVK